MAGVAVVVPLDAATAAGEGERVEPWAFVHRHLAGMEWPVLVGVASGEWVKARAVDAAVADASLDVVIVHDADVAIAPVALHAAVHAVEHGAAWAVPHGDVHRYDYRSTRALIANDHSVEPVLVRRPYRGMAGGGIVVMRRDVYDDCPLDARFVGWGAEDQCWGWALTVLHGEPWRSVVNLVHLWHPHPMGRPIPVQSEHPESDRLKRRYARARTNPEHMRALVDAGRLVVA